MGRKQALTVMEQQAVVCAEGGGNGDGDRVTKEDRALATAINPSVLDIRTALVQGPQTEPEFPVPPGGWPPDCKPWNQ